MKLVSDDKGELHLIPTKPEVAAIKKGLQKVLPLTNMKGVWDEDVETYISVAERILLFLDGDKDAFDDPFESVPNQLA